MIKRRERCGALSSILKCDVHKPDGVIPYRRGTSIKRCDGSYRGISVSGLALILGIDRFMSEARALTNLIGNGVATVVVSKWEKELDEAQLQRMMSRDVETELEKEASLHAEG